MTEPKTDSASPAAPVAAAPAERPYMPVAITRDGQYLVQGKLRTGTPPDRYFMPWKNASDPRMFVKNGQLVAVHGIVVFKFEGFYDCEKLPHREARYVEVVRSDFDPKDCVELIPFDIEKYGEDLNKAYQADNGSLPESLKSLSAFGGIAPANDEAKEAAPAATETPASPSATPAATSAVAAMQEQQAADTAPKGAETAA